MIQSTKLRLYLIIAVAAFTIYPAIELTRLIYYYIQSPTYINYAYKPFALSSILLNEPWSPYCFYGEIAFIWIFYALFIILVWKHIRPYTPKQIHEYIKQLERTTI